MVKFIGYGEGVFGRHDKVHIICILLALIARGDGVEVRSTDNEGCRANGRSLNDACINGC